MKRLLLVAALLAFGWWRRNQLDEYDRAHGFGAYADLTVN